MPQNLFVEPMVRVKFEYPGKCVMETIINLIQNGTILEDVIFFKANAERNAFSIVLPQSEVAKLYSIIANAKGSSKLRINDAVYDIMKKHAARTNYIDNEKRILDCCAYSFISAKTEKPALYRIQIPYKKDGSVNLEVLIRNVMYAYDRIKRNDGFLNVMPSNTQSNFLNMLLALRMIEEEGVA